MRLTDTVRVDRPWLLLALVPALALVLWAFFRQPRGLRSRGGRIPSLLLRLLTVCLAVLVATGVTLRTPLPPLSSFDTVILVDESHSTLSVREEMDAYVRRVLAEEEASSSRVGIIRFGRGQVTLSETLEKAERAHATYLASQLHPTAEATDLGAALRLAATLLKRPEQGRVILLSDGLETDGDGMAAAAELAEQGIRLDGVCFAADPPEREIQLLDVSLPDTVEKGEPTTLSVRLRSAGLTTARLTVTVDEKTAVVQSVSLAEGEQTVEFPYTFATPGFHKVEVTVSASSDTARQNNRIYHCLSVPGKPAVLVVDGTGAETAGLVALLGDAYEMTVVSPEEVPTVKEDLDVYGEVILLNVHMRDLPAAFDGALCAFVEEGGGLLTVGGTNTYAMGGMEGTQVADLLPVYLRDEDGPTLELMIVLDISSSMGNSVTDVASNRLDVAKAGARESVSLLRDTDYVGVVTFDANAQVVMPITPASSREDVIDAIDGIEMGYGTRYGNGLSLAQSCLLGSTNQVDARHVIFITDGKPSDSGYESIIGSMVSQGITVSTVLIYREDGTSATQALKDRVEYMASLGDGRSYLVEAASEFTAIMKEETVLSQKDLLIEGVFFPQAGDYSPVLGNLYQLPPIEGYINVSAKEGATVPFTVDNAPLYAEWQVGKGWVGSYMSDLGGRWSDFFFDYPEGRIFLDNALARLLRPDDPVKTVVQGHNLMAEAFYPEPYLDGHRVTLKVTDPAGYVETVVLTGEADGYRGLFATERTGIYRLDVTHRSSTGEEVYTETGYYAFSYLAEYDTFADPEEGRTLVSDLAERTGGTLLEADGLLFGDGSEDRFVLSDPRTWLLAAAMLLFLADIAIRKFPPRLRRKK